MRISKKNKKKLARLAVHFGNYAKELLAFTLVILLTVPSYFLGSYRASAATYTFSQTSWTGGVDTVNYPNHTDNQTGWTKYYFIDSGATVVAGAVKLEVSTTTQALTQTSASDFSAGTAGAGTFVVGANNGSGVALCTYDHGGADWTPTDGDTWDLDATGGIAIAGTHCNIGTFSIPSGTVNVKAYDGSKYGRLKIYATTISIDGTLDAGSSGGIGGWTAGFTGYGGSHGGIGENSADLRHGSSTAPTDFGDGGRDTCFGGSSGGGAIYLSAGGTMTVSGTISSNGGNGTAPSNGCGGSYSAGAGAGGSIYLTAATLAGNGAINANGGSTGHGGGGGRIAFYYTTKTFSGTTSAIGQTGGTDGSVSDAGSGSYPGYIGYLRSPSDYSFFNFLLGIKTVIAASASATFTSSAMDTGAGLYRTFGAISWTGATSTTASIKFQVASSDSSGGPWTYYGPTGVGDYYTTSSTTLNSVHLNQRYVKYQMTLESTEDLLDTPVLQSVSIGYTIGAYPTSKNLVSSPYNTADSTNIPASLSWAENLPANTDIKFQIRTAPASGSAPGTWTAWMGPGGDDTTYFTDSAGGEALPAGLRDSVNDQWIQYKLFLISDGSDTPTLSSMTVTYVVNAPPDFDSAYGTSGVAVSQISDSADSNWGKVSIAYSIRDTDTTSGTNTRGYATPSFEYDIDDGTGWHAITEGYLSSGALSNKAVDVSTYVPYTAYWNAASQIPNIATTTAKIRVTVNDNEAANNTASVIYSDLALDTKIPVLSVLRFDSSLGQMTLMASDTVNYISYNISNDANLNVDGVNGISGVWQDAGAASVDTSFSWTGTGTSSSESVSLLVRDAYNNKIATTTVKAPMTPASIDIKDASNVTTGEYRNIVSWTVYSNTASATFSGYEVNRSTNGTDYTLLTTVSDINQNYYLNTGLATTTTYYYKVNVLDTDGDRSRYTGVVSETPDGQNSIANDSVAPTISAVSYGTPESTYAVITWTTDEPSNSVVEYSTSSLNDYSSTASSTSYVSSHSVTLSGLTSGASYIFRVKSSDLAGNQATATNGSYTFTTATAMVISSVSSGMPGTNSATITWSTSADADSYVVYDTSSARLLAGTTSTTTGSATLVGGAGPSYSHSVGLTSLAENTTYYYYVRSTDAAGNTITNNNSGSYYTFDTTYDTTAPVIASTTAALVTSNSAIITWVTDELSDSQVSWGTVSGTYPSNSTRNATLSINHSAAMTDLSASTKYYYIVNSADSHGNRATSTVANLTTTAGDTTTTVYVSSSGGGGVSSIIGVDQKEHDKVKAERDKLMKEKDTTPPKITKVSVIDIKPFSANLEISTDEVTLPIVAMGTEESMLDKTVSAAKFGDNHKIPLFGLRFGTDYYLRIIASDKFGNISDPATTTFKTLYAAESLSGITQLDNAENFQDQLENIIDSVMPSLNPPFLSDMKIEEVNEDSVTVSWKTNTKTYGSVFYAPVNEYKNGTSTEAYSKSVSDTSDKTQNHTVKITGLAPLTEYHAMATSFAIFGVNGQNKDVKFVTKAPKIKPEILSVGNTNYTIYWKTSDPATSVVETKNKRTGETDETTKTELVLNHNITVEGLKPNTDYEISVSGEAVNGGQIASPQKISIRTKMDNTPPVIGNISISNAFIPNRNDRLQSVVTWKTDEKASSVFAFEEGTGEKFLNATVVGEPNSFTESHALVLSRFKPGTIYRIQISSTDEAGNTASSTIKTIFTPRESESVFNVIIKNFEDTFGYLKSN